MKWTVTTPAAALPVSTYDAMYHLRLDRTPADGNVLDRCIAAACDYARDALNSSLCVETITAVFYEGEPIYLPRGPLVAVTSVTDSSGTSIGYEVYRVGNSDRLRLTQGFTAPLTVVYTSGYANAAAVPDSIKQAILCHAGTLYEHRESVTERGRTPVPHQLEAFYRIKRRSVGVG
jgi:uncharacterized phiE125 gp8 family phage protein